MKPAFKQCRTTFLPILFVGILTITGCSHHSMMHGSAAATEPLKVNESASVVLGTYNKVAATTGSSLYFIHLKNGDTVASPVTVQFGLKGMGVAPAGIEKAGTGHHHLLVDVAELDVNAGIPVSDNHRHFGAGQTEASIALKPGVHTLQLVLGDQNHIPHHPVVMSDRITITVK
jgi:Domain of unknown function (DUF4399)